jgi:acyl carrier protein
MMKQEGLLKGLARRFGMASDTAATGPLDEAGIKEWLVQRLARHLKVDASQIDPAKAFEAYGLDSRMAVQVAGELEKLVERRLSPALLFEYSSIDQLAAFLAKEIRGEASGLEPQLAGES